jgi:uncharacterized protein
MTPQEESMLNDLIGRVEQTRLTEKDPDAEQLLFQRLGRNPDSLYILAQTVLVQKYALEQATAQLEQLKQQQAPQPAKATSFLGSLLGHRDPAPPPPPPPAPGYGAPPPPQGWTQVPAYPGYPPPGYPPSGYGGPAPSGGGSFLRSAATTAAGVAAGALAFEGVESLLHGFGGHESGFGGSNFMGGGSGGRPEEVINNYYGDSDRGQDRNNLADSVFGDNNDAANLQSAGDDLRDDSSLDDDVVLDDSSYDDATVDDSSNDDDQS